MADEEATADSFVKVDEGRRTVYLNGTVDSRMAFLAVEGLERLEAKPGDIRIVINSEGGSEQDGYAIFDAITMCRNKVIAIGLGAVHSIMAAVFQAADERRMAPNATLMMHNGTAPTDEGMKQDAVLEMADQIRKDNERYYRILATASGQPLSAVRTYCDLETYFTAEEALREGFTDTILVPAKKQWTKKRSKRK